MWGSQQSLYNKKMKEKLLQLLEEKNEREFALAIIRRNEKEGALTRNEMENWRAVGKEKQYSDSSKR